MSSISKRKTLCREKTVYRTWNPLNGHKSAHRPHRRDVTHIFCKVSCFLLKSFHFRWLRKRWVFSHTNPYISNVMQQSRWSRMLIFRAWATCGCDWVSKKTKSIVVCSGYHPEDCPLTCFEETLKPNYLQALDLNKPIVILGDFNCDMSKATSSKYKALSKFISEMNLLQLIKSPTRITDTTSTLLDIILVSSSSIVP